MNKIAKKPRNSDIREQLFNQGRTGTLQQISTPIDQITEIKGVLLDIDPDLFRVGGLLVASKLSPTDLYPQIVRQWLTRHSVLANAEVRCSGQGLHVLLWLDHPVQLSDELDRQRWVQRIKIIQRMLPTDPCAPGINAMTRPLGSRNSKNRRLVSQLHAGGTVTQAELLAMVKETSASPFKHMLNLLTGSNRVAECPICHSYSLVGLDHHGKCYGCGKVSLAKLLNSLFISHKPKHGRRASHGKAK